MLGIQRASVSRIENNYQKITAEQLQLFCLYCDASADYILGVPGNKKVFSFQDMEEIHKKINDLKDALMK